MKPSLSQWLEQLTHHLNRGFRFAVQGEFLTTIAPADATEEEELWVKDNAARLKVYGYCSQAFEDGPSFVRFLRFADMIDQGYYSDDVVVAGKYVGPPIRLRGKSGFDQLIAIPSEGMVV